MDLKTFKAEHADTAAAHRAEVETELSAKAETDRQAAVSGEQSRVLGIVGVLVGEELGAKVAAVVSSGVTAEQAKAMGAFLGAPAAGQQQQGQESEAQKDALDRLANATQKPLDTASDARAAAPDFDTLLDAEIKGGLSRGKAVAKVIKEHPEAHAAWLSKRSKEGK